MDSDVVEARHSLTHLGINNFQLYLTFKFHRLFGGEGLALNPNNDLQTLSKPFLFLPR